MSLASLFAAYGMRPERVAEVLGISPFVFDRIDSGRQGLPDVLVPRIAAIIGATDAEVRSNASRIITARSWPRSGVATPVRPDFNEPMPHVLLHPIPPVPLHPREEVVPRLVWFTMSRMFGLVDRIKATPNGDKVLAAFGIADGVPERLGKGEPEGLGLYLGAINTEARSLASLRDLSLLGRYFNNPWALAFDGDRVWVTDAGWGMTGVVAATPADEAMGPITIYDDGPFAPESRGAAGVEYGDTSSGLWKTNIAWGETYELQRVDPTTGEPNAAVPITIGEYSAMPTTCTVVGGKVFTVAYVPANGSSQARFVRVDPGALVQDAESTGHDFTSAWEWMWMPAQVAATTSRTDAALWIQEPGDPWAMSTESAILRCDQSTMVVTRIVASDDIGVWSGGADADADGNLWFTGYRYAFEVTAIYIAKVAPDGTVLARITAAEVPGLDRVGPLVVDRAGGAVWAFAIIADPELEELRACMLRIDVASAAVTDTVVVLNDAMVAAFDMVVGWT
ncbi:MAG TPA: hypothetical protein PKI27_00760 [Dermatophilaceae bacterium]|jgi:hypothetical protein|nr:hypothetical protein [Dermatophilaceae bacterium]